MYKNYLRTALRFLKQNKVFAGINVLGLSIALAASFIILIYVINELSYNSCHEKRDRVYRILSYLVEFDVIEPSSPYLLAPTLKEECPQVIRAVNTRNIRDLKLKHGNELISVRNSVSTGSGIFDIFTIPLIEGGSVSDLLTGENSIVLSRETAEKFFPGGKATGKEIAGFVGDEEQVFTVTGVFENMPHNSTFRADCFIHAKWGIDFVNRQFRCSDAETNWKRDSWHTWILTSGDNPVPELEKQFRALETKHLGEKPFINYSVQKLSDVYLHSENIANSGIRGNMKNIRLFSAIALLIILVAAVNYMILSTAVSTGRAKEIGIRKTNGANGGNIKLQLLAESMLLALVALPVALLFMWLAFPYVGELFQTKLLFMDSNLLVYALSYLGFTLFVGGVSGIYTSAYLSRLKVVDILKNPVKTGERKQAFRSTLIVLQLVIFCTFVTSALVVRSQYQFALKKDPGYYNSSILMVDLGRNFRDYPAYINSIKSNPYVSSAGGTMIELPMMSSMSSMVPHFIDKTEKVKIEGLAVDYNFLETMGIQFIEGRSFSPDFGSDLEKSAILNETAVRQLGITDPIGKTIGSKTIIGVVKDFNLHSIHSDIPPLKIEMTDRFISQVAVRYQPGMLSSVIPTLEKEWKKTAPERPFRYSVIEDITADLYTSEKNLSRIVSFSALFTLLIAAFGLFGLTLFTARLRTKEIGIKKVLGSPASTIIFSFLKANTLLVFTAVLISIPLTAFFMNDWLIGFAYHTTIKWWFFIISFAAAASVVLLTVLYHSYRASQTNPVNALKYE